MKANAYRAGYACGHNYPDMPRPSRKLIAEAWPMLDDQDEWIQGYQAGIEETVN